MYLTKFYNKINYNLDFIDLFWITFYLCEVGIVYLFGFYRIALLMSLQIPLYLFICCVILYIRK